MKKLALAAILATLGLATTANAEKITFKSELKGSSEVPPTASTGTGTAEATLDTSTKELSYTITHNGLTGPATMAHFHGPAEAGKNAGVVVPFKSPESPIKGTATLTDAQIDDLLAGKWYANVHTAANPAGEVRGQMVK